MELLERTFWYDTTKITFFWNQAKEYEEEFYYLVFELLYSKASKDDSEKIKLSKFIKDLSIPSDTIGEQISFDYEWLKTEFENILNFKAKKSDWTAQKKWKQFEEFLKSFFNNIEWLEIINVKYASDEQIDLVLKNNVNKPFWINLWSSLIVWEAKNRIDKTDTATIKQFRTTLSDHENFSKLGFFFAMNWFTSEVEKTLLKASAKGQIIVTITWDDIRKMLTSKENPIDWLEKKITDSFV